MKAKIYYLNTSEEAVPNPEVSRVYKYWRLRILYSIVIGYASFYLVRQNFSMAIPHMTAELGYTKAQIGLVITVGALIYGLGKGLMGLLGDRSNARFFMSFGLFMSALISFFLGFSTTLSGLLIFWSLNSCFQAMGWPPCARLLTHWFSPKELATKWAIWNTSQQIGGAIVLILSGFLIEHFGWRYVFFVPACLGVGLSLFLFNRLRDTPESLGLPSIESHHGLIEEDPLETRLSTKDIFLQVTKNRLVWYVCFANFFVYIVRMSVFNWAPTFLYEFKGSTLTVAGWQTACFDIAGMVGGILAGYLSDKVFSGYRGRVGACYMLLLAGGVFLLWSAPAGSTIVHFLSMALIGFLVSGPQILVGVAAADFSSKRVAGAASGLTGTVGYIGTAITGYGLGSIVDHLGWDAAFLVMVVSALLSAVFFALTWNHRSKALG